MERDWAVKDNLWTAAAAIIGILFTALQIIGRVMDNRRGRLIVELQGMVKGVMKTLDELTGAHGITREADRRLATVDGTLGDHERRIGRLEDGS